MMTLTLDQFVRNLARSGLMSSTEVTAFLDGCQAEQRPQDASALAEGLVAAKKLTPYQATAISQGKHRGLTFDEYLILEKLGEGGMGVVFKAQHRRMKRVVAIKMLPAGRLKSPEAVKRFYREVEAAARLSHPNIVTAYDAREQDGLHYLVMEYVEGRDLGTVHSEQQELLDVGQVVGYILQAARGLEYAHKHGVVHRDVKPGNLLVDQEGTVKILDMGLARVSEMTDLGECTCGDRLTKCGQMMGTCDYMAPEQAEDAHRADHRSDIYSLGCTLYRLLASQPIFPGDSFIQVLMAHRTAPIPSLCCARRDVPESLETVFGKMVAKQPEDRYQSMSEVIADLEACQAVLLGTQGDRFFPGADSATSGKEVSSHEANPSRGSEPKTTTARTQPPTENARTPTPRFEETLDYPLGETVRSGPIRQDALMGQAPPRSGLLIVIGVLGSLLVVALIALIIVLLTMG